MHPKHDYTLILICLHLPIYRQPTAIIIIVILLLLLPLSKLRGACSGILQTERHTDKRTDRQTKQAHTQLQRGSQTQTQQTDIWVCRGSVGVSTRSVGAACEVWKSSGGVLSHSSYVRVFFFVVVKPSSTCVLSASSPGEQPGKGGHTVSVAEILPKNGQGAARNGHRPTRVANSGYTRCFFRPITGLSQRGFDQSEKPLVLIFRTANWIAPFCPKKHLVNHFLAVAQFKHSNPSHERVKSLRCYYCWVQQKEQTKKWAVQVSVVTVWGPAPKARLEKQKHLHLYLITTYQNVIQLQCSLQCRLSLFCPWPFTCPSSLFLFYFSSAFPPLLSQPLPPATHHSLQVSSCLSELSKASFLSLLPGTQYICLYFSWRPSAIYRPGTTRPPGLSVQV